MGKQLGLLALLLFGLSSHVAVADTFQGTTWTLGYLPAPNGYDVTLGVDTSGYTGSGTYLDQVSIKVSDSFVSASLDSAPGGPANWTLVTGGINAGGCKTSGNGFVCADSNGMGLPVGVGTPIYQWGFDLKMANGALFTGYEGASVKGRFVDSVGRNVSLVSENVSLIASPVPEPENYVLMLAGLGLVGLIARRRLSRA